MSARSSVRSGWGVLRPPGVSVTSLQGRGPEARGRGLWPGGVVCGLKGGSGSGLERRSYGHKDWSVAPRGGRSESTGRVCMHRECPTASGRDLRGLKVRKGSGASRPSRAVLPQAF